MAIQNFGETITDVEQTAIGACCLVVYALGGDSLIRQTFDLVKNQPIANSAFDLILRGIDPDRLYEIGLSLLGEAIINHELEHHGIN